MFLLNTGHSALEEADAVPEASSTVLCDPTAIVFIEPASTNTSASADMKPEMSFMMKAVRFLPSD